MRRLLIAALAWLLASPALAQVPYFPQTLPPNSLVGNQLAVPAPTQAIPIANITNSFGTLPWFNAKSSGAVCNGSTNDTAAIQAAINAAAAAGGGQVLIPGFCAVNATLTITSQGITLIGSGPKVSGLVITSSMSTDVIQFSSASAFNDGVRNLAINFNVAPTAGAAINIGNGTNSGRIIVSDVTVTGAFNAINVSQATGGAARITNVDISNTVNDGIVVNSTNSMVIDNFSSFQNTPGGGAAIHLVNGGGIIITNSFLDQSTNAVLINPGTGQSVVDVWMTNCDLDASTNSGLTIDTSAGTGKARNMTFTNVRTGFANNGAFTVGRGIFINGAGSTDITFTGGEDVRNVQEGIYIHGGTNIRIANRLVEGNSVAGSATWNGINVDGGDKISIVGSMSGPYNDGGGNNQNNGLAIQAAFTGSLIAEANDMFGNVNGGISNGSTSSNIILLNNRFVGGGFFQSQPAGYVSNIGLRSSSPTAGIGYTTGAGGTVTQLTSKSTAVTLNASCGQITMNNASLAAGAGVLFNLTTSAFNPATDVIFAHHASGGSAASYRVDIFSSSVANTVAILVTNTTGGALAEAIVINFVVWKGSSN